MDYASFCNNDRVLRAVDLECERGGRVLFRGLSLEIRAGELVRIAGANGSGKTSLMRILCGLLAPHAGHVQWKGQDISDLREEYSRELLYIGHAPAVKGELTAAENLAFACALAGQSASREQATNALAAFGLEAGGTPVRRLSQGQRKRAALARLFLAGELPLWFLDEPFAALDDAAARRVEEHMAQHVARGASVVYTTHQDCDLRATRTVELG